MIDGCGGCAVSAGKSDDESMGDGDGAGELELGTARTRQMTRNISFHREKNKSKRDGMSASKCRGDQTRPINKGGKRHRM